MSESAQSELTQKEIIGEGNENRITEIVVYTNQAYVKRQVQAKVRTGLNRMLIETRAFKVDTESVQARVYGEGEILSVQYNELPVKDFAQDDVQQLVSKKKQLEHQRTALKNKNAVGEKQQRFLDSLIGFAETDMPTKMKTQFPTTENLQTMLEFLGDSFQNLTDKGLELKRQIEDLDREITVVERQLKKLSQPKTAAQKVVEVLFESPKAQELRIDVFYVAERALWEPVYKVDIALDLSRISLTMFARIQQKTGERWENVKLSVSNAMPLKGAALPDIESWYLSLPCSDMAWAGAAVEFGAAEDLDGGLVQSLAEEVEEEVALDDAQEPPPEADFTQAVQNELPLAFEYDLPQPINMDSGNTETLLPLSTWDMQGDFFIYAVPKNDPRSYLVCHSTADGALLAGRLNVHFGGRFVGGTLLEEKKAGEDFLINLGVERGVKIRREKITDKLTETFFGKVDRSSVAREMEYRIVMENLKEEAVQVRLMDCIPVSKTDRIQIKDVEATPKPSVNDYQEQEGVMQWDIDLKPKAVNDIRIKFFVKHPKNNPPWGL
jgi:uncharacterized protein (TIGR02231 family)